MRFCATSGGRGRFRWWFAQEPQEENSTAQANQERAEPLKPGSSAPDFALPDIQGKQRRLQDFKGKTVVVNFWAFWCDTWKDELPHLKALTGRQDELGFKLLTISVDGTRLREFSKQTGNRVPFPVLLDVGGKVSAAYHIAHVPTVLIVDPEGKVRSVHIGYPGNQAILTKIRQIAAERKQNRDITKT